MTIDDIYFNQEAHFLGRNGQFKASGVNVDLQPGVKCGEGVITLTPFTSKGILGRCSIEIPVEIAGELASALRKAVKETNRKE
jgi:hypothetical protein